MNKSQIIIIIIAVVIVLAIIYFADNHQETDLHKGISKIKKNIINTKKNLTEGMSPVVSDKYKRYNDDSSEIIVDGLMSHHDRENDPKDGDYGLINPSDPMAQNYESLVNDDYTFCASEIKSDKKDENDFVYKKKAFTKKTQKDISDLFDVDKMLPQEIEEDWFDVEPLQTTKKFKGTHLVHPKILMGKTTMMSKNPSHDVRGDIPNPKRKFKTPWNNPTIEEDLYHNGLCR